MHVASAFPPVARQWHQEATLAAYSCGGSRGFEGKPSHRVPFSPTAAPKDASRTVTPPDRSSAGSELSTRCAPTCAVHACLWRSGHGKNVRVSHIREEHGPLKNMFSVRDKSPFRRERWPVLARQGRHQDRELTLRSFRRCWRTVARVIDMPEPVPRAVPWSRRSRGCAILGETGEVDWAVDPLARRVWGRSRFDCQVDTYNRLRDHRSGSAR
jgi:hypothetical protein